MKKIVSLFIGFVLLCTVSVTAFASDTTVSLSGVPTELKKGETATITVNLSGSPATSSALVQVTLGEGLELVSGEWQKDGLIKDFMVSNGYGVIAFSSAGTMDGTVFRFVVKGKAVSTNVQSIKVDFTFKNGSTNVGTATTSKTVAVVCANHTYGSYIKANANNHTRTCTTCGAVETKAHTWNDGTQIKAPSCKENGIKTYTCTACHATKDETIPKTEKHTYGSWEQTKKPSCTVKGEETRKCTVSGCTHSETRDISATGHKLGNWEQTKKPSCTVKGEETRKCTASGCTYSETRDIKATGHSFGEWKITKKATCEAKGEETKSCSKCSFKESKELKALGHEFAKPTVTKKPTCTETGIETQKCNRCDKKTTNTIKATGHSYGEFVVTKEPTETEDGIKTATCKNCKATKEEVIPHITVEPEIPTEDTESELPETTETETPGTEMQPSTEDGNNADEPDSMSNWIKIGAITIIIVCIIVLVYIIKKKYKL